MKKLIGLCLYQVGSWLVEKSHPLLGHEWKPGALEQLAEYAPIDLEKADQWVKDLEEVLDVIVGNWE